MKVLITGGAGFIGSHLGEALIKDGHQIFIIDDLSTGSLQNIQFLKSIADNDDQVHFVNDTILNYEPMLELVGTCDYVFHMAAAVGVQYIIDNPLSSIITNVRGTEMVLELCAKFRKSVILASTSEVYGKHDHAPLVETDDCVYGPSEKSRWSYAAAKLMDEFTALAYFKTKGLKATSVRLFNTVGPRQTGRYGMVIPRFVSQAMSHQNITVYGDGTQSRTFTHVKEVVEALIALMHTPQAAGQVINIGGVEEVSILELAKRVVSLTDSTSKIQLIPYEVAYPRDFEDMQRRVPSTAKLRSLIGFAPKLELETILKDVISYTRMLKSDFETEGKTTRVGGSKGTPAENRFPL